MTTTRVYSSFLLSAGATYEAKAHTYRGGAIGSVDVAPGSEGAHAVIQADEPAALRELAAALIEAADKADAVIAGTVPA